MGNQPTAYNATIANPVSHAFLKKLDILPIQFFPKRINTQLFIDE